MLHWDRPFKTVRSGGFETGDIVWFPEGGLNASYNCVDRWAFKHPNKVGASFQVPHWIYGIALLKKGFIYTDGDHLRSR